tara:strand:+ start:86 stop:1435 length:1350 start_codon:yes stop_codon:yes gene_type:complete
MAILANNKRIQKKLDLNRLSSENPVRRNQEVVSISLSSGVNYVSFPFKGIGTNIGEVLRTDLYPQLKSASVVGWGVAEASNVNSDGNWQGSLTTIDPKKGYKVVVDSDVVLTYTNTNGIGCLYGEDDLKWTLPSGVSMVSYPYLEGGSGLSSLAFTNHGQSIVGGGTGEILESVIGSGTAMDYIDESWVGSLAQQGFEEYGAYYFNIKNVPASSPFRYFSDPTPNISTMSGNPEYGGAFFYRQSEFWSQWVIQPKTIYKWSKGNNLERPVGVASDHWNCDWVGAFRGNACVGASNIVADDWTSDSNGAWTGYGSFFNVCQIAIQGQMSSPNQIYTNCQAGDLVRWVFYDHSEGEYYMMKFYDHTLQKVLEYIDPLGDGAFTDVSTYICQPSMGNEYLPSATDCYGSDSTNALKFGTSFGLVQLGTRFSLVAVPLQNTDGTYNSWTRTNQ